MTTTNYPDNITALYARLGQEGRIERREQLYVKGVFSHLIHMNNIRSRAEEIILQELVFA